MRKSTWFSWTASWDSFSISIMAVAFISTHSRENSFVAKWRSSSTNVYLWSAVGASSAGHLLNLDVIANWVVPMEVVGQVQGPHICSAPPTSMVKFNCTIQWAVMSGENPLYIHWAPIELCTINVRMADIRWWIHHRIRRLAPNSVHPWGNHRHVNRRFHRIQPVWLNDTVRPVSSHSIKRQAPRWHSRTPFHLRI